MKALPIFTLSLLLLLAVKVDAQQFTLTGHFTKAGDEPIILKYMDNTGKTITDSAAVKNGTFVIKGNIDQPVMASLSVSHRPAYQKNGEPNYKNFFLEPQQLTLTGDYNNLSETQIKGSKTQQDYNILISMEKPSSKHLNELENRWLAHQTEYFGFNKLHDDHKRDSIGKIMDSLNDIMVTADKLIKTKFIKEHPQSYVSAYELESYKTRWNLKDVSALYARFSPKLKTSSYGQQIKSVIDGENENSAGKAAKDFEATDYTGKLVKLSDIKKKYVLLDFWGSWCAPCRASMPHLKKLYAKYHDKGFEVIAIAAEDNAPDWDAAIKKDGTNIWNNILEPNIRDSNVDKSKLIDQVYQINVFPTKILVKDGVIVGRYDGGEGAGALDKKLIQIFGK